MDTLMQNALRARSANVENLSGRLEPLMEKQLERRRIRLERATLTLRTAGPMETMKRGYAVITRNGSVMRSAEMLETGDQLTVHLSDGKALTTVDNVMKG